MPALKNRELTRFRVLGNRSFILRDRAMVGGEDFQTDEAEVHPSLAACYSCRARLQSIPANASTMTCLEQAVGTDRRTPVVTCRLLVRCAGETVDRRIEIWGLTRQFFCSRPNPAGFAVARKELCEELGVDIDEVPHVIVRTACLVAKQRLCRDREGIAKSARQGMARHEGVLGRVACLRSDLLAPT